jgi:hypothetical protein
MPLPCEANPVSCFMSAKSAVKSAALILGMAADDVVVEDVVVEDGVADELHAETETTSPNENNALVSAKDLRAVSIDFPSVDNATL